MSLISNPEEEAKWRDLFQPEIRKEVVKAKIDALWEAKRAMQPMLRDMISRTEAVRIIQELIEKYDVKPKECLSWMEFLDGSGRILCTSRGMVHQEEMVQVAKDYLKGKSLPEYFWIQVQK